MNKRLTIKQHVLAWLFSLATLQLVGLTLGTIAMLILTHEAEPPTYLIFPLYYVLGFMLTILPTIFYAAILAAIVHLTLIRKLWPGTPYFAAGGLALLTWVLIPGMSKTAPDERLMLSIFVVISLITSVAGVYATARIYKRFLGPTAEVEAGNSDS